MSKGGVPAGVYLEKGEFLFQCPYEQSHIVVSTRSGRHLQKCRRNYVKAMGSVMFQCRHDGCPQEFLLPELLVHQDNCCKERLYKFNSLQVIKGNKKPSRTPPSLHAYWKGCCVRVTGEMEDDDEEEEVEDDDEVDGGGWRLIPLPRRKKVDEEEEDWGKEDTGKVFSLFTPLY